MPRDPSVRRTVEIELAPENTLCNLGVRIWRGYRSTHPDGREHPPRRLGDCTDPELSAFFNHIKDCKVCRVEEEASEIVIASNKPIAGSEARLAPNQVPDDAYLASTTTPGLNASMPEPPKIEFRHRLNRENQWESICMSCYRTAGISETEQLLADMEETHECDVSITSIARRLSELLRSGRMPSS
jgi:hypothetical protein